MQSGFYFGKNTKKKKATMFKSIKLLSFDITKTLLFRTNQIGKEYMKIATKYGLVEKSDDTIPKLNEAFERNFKRLNQELPNFGLNKNMTSVDWWSRLVISMFRDVGYTDPSDEEKLKQATQQLFQHYSRGNCWHLNPHARELLSELHKKRPDITLAVASNFDERLETILRDLDVRHYFKFMFISRLIGVAKPDPEFFRYVIKTVEIEPHEYLHLGDDVQNDYFPVKSIQANAMVIDPSMEAAKTPGVRPEDVLPDLKHFKQLIILDE